MKCIQEVYQAATRDANPYIFDLKQNTPEQYRIRRKIS